MGDDEAASLKEDGLKGTHLLSSAGIGSEEETEFLQADKVADWTPKGQAVKASRTYKDDAEEKESSSLQEDGLEGDDVLSAVGMGDHMVNDEMSELGTIKADELDLDLD